MISRVPSSTSSGFSFGTCASQIVSARYATSPGLASSSGVKRQSPPVQRDAGCPRSASVRSLATSDRHDRVLPELDGPPRLPEEVQGATQDIMTGGTTG